MGIIQYIFYQLLVVLYQLSTFHIWGLDLAGGAQSFRDYVLNSPVIHLIEFILVPVTVFLFIGLINVSRKHHELNQRLIMQQEESAVAEVPQTALASRWQEILQHIDSVREGEWKFAIIEADKLVDDQLKNLFPGETMGERLMNIDKTHLLTIDGLWEAHKVRNRLAHDTNYFLRHAEAVHAIRLFEATLKELGAL